MVTLNKAATSLLQPSTQVTCSLHVHVCNCLYYLHHIKYMYVQLLRLGNARKLCPRTTHFSKRKRRAASGGIRTRDVLRARQTLYQLSHRGSSAGQAKSFKGKGVSSLTNRATHFSICTCTCMCDMELWMYSIRCQELMSGEAAKERVTTAYTWVPSKSKSLAS